MCKHLRNKMQENCTFSIIPYGINMSKIFSPFYRVGTTIFVYSYSYLLYLILSYFVRGWCTRTKNGNPLNSGLPLVIILY